MTLAHVAKLGFVTQKTDIGAQMINGSTREIYEIVMVDFLVQVGLKKIQFFERTFLLADTSIGIVLEIYFFTLSDVDIWFTEKELIWRSYTTAEILSITGTAELINKRGFATAALDQNPEIFVIYIVALDALPGAIKITIHSFRLI